MATGINFSETMTPSNIVFEPVVNKAEGIRAESNLNTVATLLKVGGAGAIDYAKYKTEEEAKKQVEKTIEEYDPSSPSKTVENQKIAYNLEKKITNPETARTIKLFIISFGVASSFMKLVNNISGREMLKITFESISFELIVRTPALAAMTPIITTMASIAICTIMILVSITKVVA